MRYKDCVLMLSQFEKFVRYVHLKMGYFCKNYIFVIYYYGNLAIWSKLYSEDMNFINSKTTTIPDLFLYKSHQTQHFLTIAGL